jgi:hypothetical protein
MIPALLAAVGMIFLGGPLIVMIGFIVILVIMLNSRPSLSSGSNNSNNAPWYLSSNGFGKYMSNRGPAFNASAIVKQTRAFSGYQPNWIRQTVPSAPVNDDSHSEVIGDKVRDFIADSQKWEALRFMKNGYRVVVPNNRKIIFVKGS